MNLIDTIPRIEAWNAARYAREYNEQLAIALLEEEINEAYTALLLLQDLGLTYEERLNAFCEFIDGLGDIFFVAVGVLWKLDKQWSFSDVQWLAMTAHHEFTEAIVLIPVDPIAGVKQVLANVLAIASNTLSYEDFFEVVTAICDSNDSKAIHKVASDVKANSGSHGKGPDYFPPTEVLMEITLKYIVEVPNAA